PTTGSLTEDHNWSAPNPPWQTTSKGSYGMNLNLENESMTLGNFSSAASVATLAAFADCTWYSSSGPNIGDPGPDSHDSIYQASRHFDGINIAYADGHVKWMGKN